MLGNAPPAVGMHSGPAQASASAIGMQSVRHGVSPVVGIDVVEVSPPYDHADITAALANRVVLEALSAIARKRQDERDGTTWDPGRPLLDR